MPEPTLPLTEDERIDFEERAAIMEYDGGLTRSEAEEQAMLVVLRNRLEKPAR